jgi:hypothetical protein
MIRSSGGIVAFAKFVLPCAVKSVTLTLFNKRDYTAAGAVLVSQLHSTQRPFRAGLFNLIKAAPASLKHEPGVILRKVTTASFMAGSPTSDRR